MFNKNNWDFSTVVYFIFLTMNIVCMVLNGIQGDVAMEVLNGFVALAMFIALLDERK